MNFKKIKKLFNRGSCLVYGVKGSGKDLLMSNIAVRSKNQYISNINYGGKNKYISLCLPKFFLGNDHNNFIKNKINQYTYPYADKVDIFISDCGIYFPSQFCNELNKNYLDFVNFMALSRHLGNCSVHCNAQNVARIWDKIREQSETYILCRSSIVLFGKIVIQRVRVYENYDSAVKKVPPFRVKAPLFCKAEVRQNIKLQKELYNANHGNIKSYLLIYFNKSKYDSRRFKTILEKSEVDYENL